MGTVPHWNIRGLVVDFKINKLKYHHITILETFQNYTNKKGEKKKRHFLQIPVSIAILTERPSALLNFVQFKKTFISTSTKIKPVPSKLSIHGLSPPSPTESMWFPTPRSAQDDTHYSPVAPT